MLHEDHLLLAYPLRGIADCSAESGDEVTALSSYKRAYAIRSSVMEATNVELVELRESYVEYLRSVGLHAEADELLSDVD